MAELIVEVKGDVTKLRKQIKDVLNQNFGGDVTLGGDGGGKDTKKSQGLLGDIIGKLAPLGLLLSLQPIADLMKIVVSLAGLTLLTFFKLLKGLDEWLGDLNQNIADFLKEGFNNVVDTVSKWVADLIEWVKVKWDDAIEWLKGLPEKIWKFLKQGFDKAVDFIKNLPKNIWNFLKELGSVVWEFLKTGFNDVVDWLKELGAKIAEHLKPAVDFLKNLWENIKSLPKDIWNFIKELPNKIWTATKVGFKWITEKVKAAIDWIKKLPEKIWDKMKNLGKKIANAIKEAIKGIFGGSGSTNAGDAIIKPGGQIIKTNPKDTIVAAKDPSRLGGGGGAVYNFYGVTPQEMIDVMKRELGVDVNRATRF